MPPETAAILPEERIRQMHAEGWWGDRLITDFLDAAADTTPDAPAITGHNSMREHNETLSYGELRSHVDRIAAGLAAYGIGPGEVVSYQLPNWWEFAALHFACIRIGAISNPVMPIFRKRELSFMLDFAESKIFIVPRSFRGFDYPTMAAELCAELPHLEDCLVIGGEGENSFEARILDAPQTESSEALFSKCRPSPDDVIQILYTSGTTGQPKGILHTTNTLFACINPIASRLEITAEDVILSASPLAHQTGFLYLMLMPVMQGGRAVYQDIWSGEEAARQIATEGVTFTMASTPFLSDFTDAVETGKYDVSSLRVFIAAGAPIPRALVQRAMEKTDMVVISGWGMSENGLVTTTAPGIPEHKIFETDGKATDSTEVRVVDDQRNPLPPDTEGALEVRSAGAFVGYLKRPEAHDTDEEEWFRTGDRARQDADGYIRIIGRTKDIVIRGGENVPVVEVEEMLYRHPAIAEAAIVAMPDERLGERGCAFVALKPDTTLSMEEMVVHLEAGGMARNYFPERLEILDELPRTASGKIQKFELRQMAESLTPQKR